MTEKQVYDFLYDWIDYVVNPKTTIGTCVFTPGLNVVTGTNFITGGIIQVGSYVKLGTDDSSFFAKIDSIDSETQITLSEVYDSEAIGGTGEGQLTDEYIPIVIGSENVPAVSSTYIVIDEPPISNRKVGNTQVKSNYVDGGDNPKTNYSNTYEMSVSIIEVNNSGIYIPALEETIEEPEIMDLWQAQNDISFQNMGAGANINAILGDIIEKRYSQDVFLLYTKDKTIDSEIIEEVQISERNYNLD